MPKKPNSAEIYPGAGLQSKKIIPKSSKNVIEKFREFSTPDISDLLNRLYTMSSNIKNLINNKKIVGPACTVKVFPGDNLMLHKALDIAGPGDIIVVDSRGCTANAIMGDLIARKAHHRKIAAFVVDGLIRDLPGIQEVDIPVFATGVTPIGPLHRGPGEINFPITCGGTVVNPGDIIVGDECGVVVIRQELEEELLDRLYAQKEKLADYINNVKKGNFSNDWVDHLLEEGNCRHYD